MRMTAIEKEGLCATMAVLFFPPEVEGIEQVRQESSLLRDCLESWGGDPALLSALKAGGDAEPFCRELRGEYERLFDGKGGEFISLVESCHKPWTREADCHLSFAREEGFLMGDCAVHLAHIFQQLGLEVPGPFRACPDHLALELEFLSLLYRKATDREVKQFMKDHLDWVSFLKKELIRFHPHPFYLSAAELLDGFLSHEKNRLEIQDDGEKNLH
jgi:TorA maturation chaperone TorD